MPGLISNQFARLSRLGQRARQVGALALDPVENLFEHARRRRFGLFPRQAGEHALPVLDLGPQRLVRFQSLGKGAAVLLAEQPEDILRRLAGPGLHWLRHSCNFSTAR